MHFYPTCIVVLVVHLTYVCSFCDWTSEPESNHCYGLSSKFLANFSLYSKIPPASQCNIIPAGHGWGRHSLCQFKSSSSCRFISFGISNDYSFDRFLAHNKSCDGVALDPSVVHSSQLFISGGEVLFFKVGAKMLDFPDIYNNRWLMTSVPSLIKFLKYDHLDVLKMDCEGCEYSLARDIALEDPAFFNKIDQFALETHTSKIWVKSARHAHYLGLLFAMLDASGLKLRLYEQGNCGHADESVGCDDSFLKAGYECKYLCSNYLFARDL